MVWGCLGWFGVVWAPFYNGLGWFGKVWGGLGPFLYVLGRSGVARARLLHALMWSEVASLLHVVARSGMLWDGIGWFGRLGWSGVVWACFCLFLLGWSAVVWGWSGVVWDNMHSFLHVLDLSGRWSQVVWVVLGVVLGGLGSFLRAPRWYGIVRVLERSGVVWGGLGSFLRVVGCSGVAWGGLGTFLHVLRRSGAVWGLSGFVSSCFRILWGGSGMVWARFFMF